MEGKFVPTWKTAVVRPPLKKAGLDRVNSNYRPVKLKISVKGAGETGSLSV